MWNRVTRWLFQEVDGASLAALRAFFGAIMFFEALDLLRPLTAPETSAIVRQFDPAVMGWMPPYFGFEWLRPLPPNLMRLVAWGLALCSVLLAVGFFSRLAALGVLLSWTYLFLLDATRQNNHYYLMSLMAGLLVLMPTARCGSVDRWLRHRWRGQTNSGPYVPFWTVFLLRAQLLIMYFYGGVAKLSVDWLRDAEPVGIALARPEVLAPFRPYLSAQVLTSLGQLLREPATAYFFAYTGLLFDLAIGPLLLIRRTRIFGVVLMLIFHTTNHVLLFDNIGWFPLMAVLTTTIFLEPDWPRRVARWLRQPTLQRPDLEWLVGGMLLVPVVGMFLGWKLAPTATSGSRATVDHTAHSRIARRLRPLVVGFVGLWLLVQIVVPLRHFAIPGNVNWTSEGDRFAWRMKAASRRPGPLKIVLRDARLIDTSARSQALTIDWAAWEGDRAVYQEVDSETLAWDRLPEWLVVYQPLVGERIVWNPAGAAAVDGTDAIQRRQRAQQQWERLFGAAPRMAPAIGLGEFTARIADRLRRRNHRQAALAPLIQQLQRFAAELARASTGENTSARRAAQLAMLRRVVSELAASPEHRSYTQRLLAQLEPFALQGARRAATSPSETSGEGTYFVQDIRLLRRDRSGDQRVDRQRWESAHGRPCTVYVDFLRLGGSGWQRLPREMLFVDSRHRPGVLINPHAAMIQRTVRIMAARPYMIHQYVNHVARQWQSRFARRPRIYVDSFMALNRRPMQRLIAPGVDLAAAPLWLLRHNPWILPLRQTATADRHGEPPR